MKTLVNKNNPEIRITAPEIDVHEEEEMYLIPVSDYCIPMCIDDWALVEEEPVDLEKELNEYLSCEDNNPFDWDWRDKRDCARHFYELGLNARKEE